MLKAGQSCSVFLCRRLTPGSELHGVCKKGLLCNALGLTLQILSVRVTLLIWVVEKLCPVAAGDLVRSLGELIPVEVGETGNIEKQWIQGVSIKKGGNNWKKDIENVKWEICELEETQCCVKSYFGPQYWPYKG